MAKVLTVGNAKHKRQPVVDYTALADEWHEMDKIESNAKRRKDEIRAVLLDAVQRGIPVVGSNGKKANLTVSTTLAFNAADALPVILEHDLPVSKVLRVTAEFPKLLPKDVWQAVPHQTGEIVKLTWSKP